MATSHDGSSLAEGLRVRHVDQSEIVKEHTLGQEPMGNTEERERKTFGRTPNGTVFTVPITHDMVSQLLDPRQPKNLADIFVLIVLGLHILLLYALPGNIARPVFAIVYLFWRGCYNIGIGYLLQIQSHHRRLVTWAKRFCLFEDPATGKNPRPWLYKLLKHELETKIPKDYNFEEAPIEYNTWLVFRRVVDLILMCDFTSYCLFAIACGNRPVGEGPAMTVARWAGGLLLVGLNLWIKLDAHRVVKDYAWYWGDFFYLIDQELTFDGVFEMAPHPMYSVGYVGYYGISMMAASYEVLFISIVAHAAQFAFLVYVENPHIEKTYNPPPPRRRVVDSSQPATPQEDDLATRAEVAAYADLSSHVRDDATEAATLPSPLHNLLGFRNIDLFRVTDVSVFLLIGYVAVMTAFTPSTPVFQVLSVIHAIAWRLWCSIGLGIVLGLQSKKKTWTRHFVKYGESAEEAWRQWKSMHYLSTAMCWASFIAAAWKLYSLPPDWGYGLTLLRHVLGAGFVTLHVWTAVSIYESLGEFGWFFGDFFFDHAPKLTYSGIYRFLNNPERILGLAGLWGAVCITNSRAIFFLALLSHTLSLAFIQLVEKPHMDKLYGRSLRKEAGLTKSLRRSLPPPLKQWQGSLDRVLGDTGHFVEEFLDAARPKLAAGVSTFVKDTSALFSQYPARLTVTRLAPDLAGFNPKDYSLSIQGAESDASDDSSFATLTCNYGDPIKVQWTAPANHSKKDWVGLYRVVDSVSREATRVSSAGRWVPTTPNEFDSSIADSGILIADMPTSEPGSSKEEGGCVQGEMEFKGDKLWWTQGVFEFRYHHDGKHNVMAISSPFEIRLNRFDEDDVQVDEHGLVRSAVADALLPVVQNCFDRDPEIAPSTVDESFGSLVEREGKYARRVVYAIHQMFGVEFAPGVVLADGNVRKLAWRICNAKLVLAPYSMSHSKGMSTPTDEND
ncbi:MAG: phosphatidylethanolamine N-methyltransferase [Claussenomyces sp. TS43310]|nr:MAG: phosphatidylethanolamine N-methyltransferase [Claussenomyces sp. TS43310]